MMSIYLKNLMKFQYWQMCQLIKLPHYEPESAEMIYEEEKWMYFNTRRWTRENIYDVGKKQGYQDFF